MSHHGLETLTREECLALLATESLGRVGVRVGETQAILPVNFVLHEDDIVFRTDPGMKLMAAVLRTKVVFEADHVEPEQRHGWSVNVVGHIEELRTRAEREPILALPLGPWAEGVRDNVVRIRSEQVSGRRIVHGG
jgi:nitroimidazol reductase NimA-like FMN-containing flavoprotein (pyridoxamine 5'-phosphate oxidase superfamily)